MIVDIRSEREYVCGPCTDKMTIRVERCITRGPNDHHGRHCHVYNCKVTRNQCVGLFFYIKYGTMIYLQMVDNER